MKEKLQCTQCDAFWERERARGRKPIVCPECAEINNAEEAEWVSTQVSSKSVEVEESQSNKTYKFYIPPVSHWYCDSCDTTLSAHVGIIEIPTHSCKNKRNEVRHLLQKIRKKQKELSSV